MIIRRATLGPGLIGSRNGKDIAFLLLDKYGVVQWVGVDRPYRREGIATALWRAAEAMGLEPKHSPCRGPEGTRWALAVGGDLPRLHSLPCSACGEG